ncbi:MAG: signal peptidase I [Mogibacterium sp.]|nr:signal peptidase I [Mogibacterium sp.]
MRSINNNGKMKYGRCGSGSHGSGGRVFSRHGYRSRSSGTSADKSRPFLSRLAAFLIELAVTAGLVAAVFTLMLGVTVQHGNDMYPAIRDGDIILYLRHSEILNTEAVVYAAEGKIRTGRTAACAGTIVGCTGDGQLTFDGIFMPVSFERGIYQRTYAAGGERLPLTIEENNYFILGDNRDEAKDSRIFGQIGKERIKGRVIGILRRRQI